MQKLRRNPVEPIDPPTPKSPEKDFLDESQLANFLETAEQKVPYLAPLFHLATNTGMRQGELCGLRWKDMDFDRKVLSVRQQLTQSSYVGIQIQDVKSDSSKRDINLAPQVIKILEEHKKRQHQWRMKVGGEAWNDHDLLDDKHSGTDFDFTERHGKPIRPDKVYNKFKSILEEADLPDVNFHSLRHSHASILIKHGRSIRTIADRLGHSSVQLTLDTYGHLMEGMQADAAEEFAQVIYSS